MTAVLGKVTARVNVRLGHIGKFFLAIFDQAKKDKPCLDVVGGTIVTDCKMLKECIPDFKQSQLCDIASLTVLAPLVKFSDDVKNFAQDRKFQNLCLMN